MGATVTVLSLFLLLLEIQAQRQFRLEQNPVTRLGSYRINKDFITLSGFSSGGSFAQQLFFSHSSLIHGIASFSHTYYRCGPITGRQVDFDNECTRIGNATTSVETSVNNALLDIRYYSDNGLIDNITNLYNKPLYIYAGSKNWLFTEEMSLRARDVFEPFIINPNSIRAIVQEANLTLPTNRPDYPPCPSPPNRLALSNCGFSGALESLQFLLGSDAVRPPSSRFSIQPLLSFDQNEFFYDIDPSNPNGRHDMDSIGFLYIPKNCQNSQVECLLHFYFHGCMVGREFVGAEHIRNSGFLEIAETNGIIMVFPQALASPQNDIGCWDTYGVTGPLYATKAGAQVTVVRNMLARILRQNQVHLGTSPPISPQLDQQRLPSPQPIRQPISQPQPIGQQPDFFSRFFNENSDVFRRTSSYVNSQLSYPPPLPQSRQPVSQTQSLRPSDFFSRFYNGNDDVFRLLENLDTK